MTRVQDHHRPGPFKQVNKRHNSGRHRTKGQLDDATKGRSGGAGVVSRRARREQSRVSRRHQLKQRREHRRGVALAQKRQLGTADSPPFLTAVVSLADNDEAVDVLNLLKSCDESATVTDGTVVTVCSTRLKTRMSFISPSSDRLYDVLDAVKVSDTVLFLWPSDGQLSKSADTLLSCIKAQGLPAVLNVVRGARSVGAKRRDAQRKSLKKALDYWSLDAKLHALDTASDAQVLLRQVSSGKKRRLSVQRVRPHLLVDKVECGDSPTSLRLFGYVRGRPLDVNQLIHICGYGDYQLDQIDLAPDPCPLSAASSDEMRECRQLARADATVRETLESEAPVDALDAEQTWPSAADLAAAERATASGARGGRRACSAAKKRRRVPAGTSEYQAAWIVDDDAEADAVADGASEGDSGSDGDDDDDEEEPMSVAAAAAADEDGGGSTSGDDDCADSQSVATESQMDTTEFDAETERAELEKFRRERENEQFPDEMDTPFDTPARVRFQRYRGLKSFRTSEWDPKENLPANYARIFQFQNFLRTKRRVLKEERDGAMPGWYVCLHVADAPADLLRRAAEGEATAPLVVFGLLPHEQRMSVLNVTVRRRADCSLTVASKQPLVFHVGYRRFTAAPIFSQHTNGDKHKGDGVSVATVFAPVVFPPASVLVFAAAPDGTQELVATGAVLNVDPNRVVAKRVVLSGHPYKINRKSVVVRYMFFSREDVAWFKPVELRTKNGCRGHIGEAVGTHGHMKCSFNSQVTSQDTVLLNLYKRVFPKWTFNGAAPPPVLPDAPMDCAADNS